MKKTVSIKENRDFKRLYNRGKSVVTDILVLYYIPKKEGNRFGITVGKKYGNAVKRNHAKRLIRECYRRFEDSLIKNGDLVFVVRSKMEKASFCEVLSAVEKSLKKLGLIE